MGKNNVGVRTEALLASSEYTPNRILDALLDHWQLRNDAALSRRLGVAPPVISKFRHKRLPIGAAHLLHIMDATDWSLEQVRELAGMKKVRV